MKWVKWLVRGAVALALAAAGGAAWLLGTESGLRWALGFAPGGLELEAPRGTLLGAISFERVGFQGSEARKVSLEVNLLALLADTISVESVRIDSLRLTKTKSSDGTTAMPPFRIRIADAELKSVVFEGYEINDLRFDYYGSRAGHEAEAFLSAAGARAHVKAALAPDLSLKSLELEARDLNLAVIDPSLPQSALQVRIKAAGLAGTVAVANPEPGPIDRGGLPFRTVEASFATDLKVLNLENLKALLHPAGTLQGRGSVTLERQAFEVRVAELDLRGLYSTLRRTRLSGPVEITLAPGTQKAKGTLAQEDLSLAAEAERAGERIEVHALRARAGESEATGRGHVDLVKPLRFSADLKLARFDPSRFGDYPAGSINGTVKARGDLGGAGSAAWEIGASTLLGQPFASRGAARLQGERIRDADAWVTLGANRASAKGSFGEARDSLAWTLHVPDLGTLAPGFGGEIRASGTASGGWKQPSAQLEAQASSLRLAENLVFSTATVKASGTLEKHEGEVAGTSKELDLTATLRGGWRADAWRGEIVALKNAGAYPLELKTSAVLEASTARVALGRFEADIAGGHATVDSVRWEGRRLSSSGRVGALPAQWILTTLGVKRVTGDLRLDADWALASTPKLNGRLALSRASGDLMFGEVAAELARASVEAQFTDDRVAATGEIATRMGSARIEAKSAGLAPDSALQFTAQIEATELRSLTGPLWTQARVSGRVSATLHGTGTLAAPAISGTLRGDALGVEVPPWGVALRDGVVRAEIDANRLRITEARILAGDGTLSASGTVPLALRFSPEAPVTLEWQAAQFRLFGRPDRRLIVSGRGATSFDGKRLGLSGELRADSGHFEIAEDSLPQLDDDVEVAGKDGVPPRKRAPLPVDLDLQLDLGSRLTLRAYGYTGGLGGKVRLSTGPAGELLAQGRVEAVRGRFHAYGQELEVDPGLLAFDGPLEAPGLDISAWRRRQAVEAGLRVTGTLRAPRVELISNPPVNDSEKLSWLVLGRAPTQANAADLAMLQAASGAMFGRLGEVPLHRRFAERLGFDELTVRGSSELATNVVALGKRASDNVYVSFEQAIGTTTEYLVKLDYTLTQHVMLRGQTGTTSGVGVVYRYSWD